MSGYHLADFGSYTVGGTIHTVSEGTVQTINFTRDVSYQYDPRGDFAVAHSYVQYFVPAARNDSPPVVLVHGGGLSGSYWESTPDGRPGWLPLLLQRGFEVHVIDLVERGRSGFSPQIFSGDPILRSMNEAWSLFRFGSADNFSERVMFDHCRFPESHLESFARSFVPRWLSTTEFQTAALTALIEKLKHCVVICHSQGGEIAYDAASRMPANVNAIIAIEPSGAPKSLKVFSTMPFVIVQGDYLSIDQIWQSRAASWKSTVTELSPFNSKAELIDLPAALGPGNTHLPMLDVNNKECLDLCLRALN